MQPYPHHYPVTATGGAIGIVTLRSAGVDDLHSAPPPEFDGPGDVWSPESLLCAAVADCFILSFRGVARAARLDWQNLECEVTGTLERVDNVTRFTRFATRATLTVPAGIDEAKARSSLERAEHVCLISNSLNGERTLDTSVIVQPAG